MSLRLSSTNHESPGFRRGERQGSYDCPQVWTLRRFRDNTLANSILGRAFIRTYYAVSPTIVRWFGNTQWFRKLWRSPLDKLVSKLQEDGVESTPYHD